MSYDGLHKLHPRYEPASFSETPRPIVPTARWVFLRAAFFGLVVGVIVWSIGMLGWR